MEKKLSHFQNYTDFACEHALRGDVRRVGNVEVQFRIQSGVSASSSFLFNLLSFSAKSLLASEQRPRV